MNARLRLLLEFLLVVAVFAVGIYAFNQFQLLSETQANLSVAQSDATSLAETAASDLSSAQLAATQAAEEANATSTENSNLINSGYGTATWVALVNNANQQRSFATSTQVAENAANDINNINATSTQIASENSEAQANLAATNSQAATNLDNANATSTEAANQASTELAVVYATSTQAADTARLEIEELQGQVSDLGTQITDLDNELADTRENMATQRADLEAANNTIATQESQIASQSQGGNGSGSGANTDGLVLIETSRFEMMVFDDYIIVNYEEDIEDALDEIRDLGEDFEFIADALEENIFLEIAGVRDGNDFELMLVSYVRESREVPLDDYMESLEEVLEDDDIDIESNEILELGGQEVGRIFGTSGPDFAQVQYIIQDGRNYWSIVFLSTVRNAENRLEDFDASVATFRVR